MWLRGRGVMKKSLNYIYIGDLLDVDCILLIRGC